MLAACLPCVKGGAFRPLHSDGRRTKALLSPQGCATRTPHGECRWTPMRRPGGTQRPQAPPGRLG
jgi:hypothetical protein